MTIRSKLRNLLLVATLTPLLVCSLIFGVMLLGLGTHLAEDTKNYLVEQSHGYLGSLIRDADLLVKKDFQIIDWILASQKHEVEQRITHNAQETITDKLESLTSTFLQLREKSPGLILRQYLLLSSGKNYILSENSSKIIPFDLSEHQWLSQAIVNHASTRKLIEDPLDQSLNLLIGLPIYSDDKSLLGMTAAEISLDRLLQFSLLPETFQSAGMVLLARIGKQTGQIEIVAEATPNLNWRLQVNSPSQESVLAELIENIKVEVTNNLSGVVMISHQDKIRHWAYGAVLWDGLFRLVMFEHDQVVAIAMDSKQHILGKIRFGSLLIGLSLFVFASVAVLVAWHYSLTITEPARKLSNAFNRLAEGDFTAKVQIDTGDEIETLGDNFNDLGEKLEDRQRMAASLAMAREVQQKLLPHHPPEIERVDLFAKGIPCDEVGGDYYDFIEHSQQDNNLLGIAVGDVTGHGVPAALLMASARGILRSHTWCHGDDLRLLFQLLNRHLTDDSAHEQFMTLFYGVLDHQNQTLTWNSAGHGPIFLYRYHSQSLEELEVTGPPLGIDASLQSKPLTIDNLVPGDILVTGTDGLWECRNRKEEFWGIENFRKAFLQVSTDSADNIGNHIFAELKKFQQGHAQEDDMSLVIAKIV